jgi:stage III sporulation protein AA
MTGRELLMKFSAGGLRAAFSACGALEGATEARVRAGKPLIIKLGAREVFAGEGGLCGADAAYRPDTRDIEACLDIMSGHSLYACAEELSGGFITLPGGHRVGVCGRAVVENGKIKTIKRPTGLNIRVARQVRGCAAALAGRISGHTVIIGPPGSGKTTLLRDVVRVLSEGGRTAAVIDERSEIAGGGGLDLGPRTDVLDGCPKAEGIMMAVRALSPEIAAVDEIGGAEDAEAVLEAAKSGVTVVCTAHGAGTDDFFESPRFKRLAESRVFKRYVVVSAKGGPGFVEAVYDGNMARL